MLPLPTDATGVLMQSLGLLGEKGLSLKEKSLTNLGVALLRARGGKATTADLHETWTQMAWGSDAVAGVAAALEAATHLGYARPSLKDTFELTEKAKGKDLITVIAEAFPEFEAALRKEWATEYDAYLDSGCRVAFVPSVKAFFYQAVESTLNGGRTKTLSAEKLADEIEGIARDHGVTQPRTYADALIIWARRNPKSLQPAVLSLLTLVATLQLYSAHNKMAKATREAIKGTELAFDSNLLVQILCPKTSDWHAVVKEIVALSSELGVKFYTYDIYVDELRDLVHATSKILDPDTRGSGWVQRPNQLIHEYQARRSEGAKAVLESFQRYEKTIAEWGIEVRSFDWASLGVDEGLRDTLHEYYMAGGAQREPKAVTRDCRAIQLVVTRQKSSTSAIPNPWLLTFDGKLVGGEHLYRRTKGGKPVCIHVSTWLAGVAAMIELDDNKFDREGISAAWLGLAVSPVERFTAAEVIEVTSLKLHLPEKERQLFVRDALHSKFIKEFDRTLRRRDFLNLPPLFNEIMGEAVQKMGQDLAYREQEVEELRTRLRQHLWGDRDDPEGT